MTGYRQYCPLAKAAEVVAERWTPLVLRELLFGESTFNDIQRGVPLMSRSLLSKRLRQLEKAGVVERRRGRRGPEYHLTEAGRELEDVLVGMANWGVRWTASEVDREGLDPRPLMWDIRRRLDTSRMPEGRVVVQFVFPDVPRAPLMRSWLVWDPPEVDVCYRDPGHPVDLVVSTALATLIRVWIGEVPIRDAIDSGSMRVDGRKALVGVFPGWLKMSVVAHVPRPPALGSSA